MIRGVLALACLAWLTSKPAEVKSERLSATEWQLLAVAYPDGRDVSVVLGGGEKTLTAKGRGKVKWRENTANVELQVENLPSPDEIGTPGAQYVLWAVNSDKKSVNLGAVPLNGKSAKWNVQVPFRIFGLLVTAEKTPQVTAPGSAVALESRLPSDPTLVLPVFRVDIPLSQ